MNVWMNEFWTTIYKTETLKEHKCNDSHANINVLIVIHYWASIADGEPVQRLMFTGLLSCKSWKKINIFCDSQPFQMFFNSSKVYICKACSTVYQHWFNASCPLIVFIDWNGLQLGYMAGALVQWSKLPACLESWRSRVIQVSKKQNVSFLITCKYSILWGPGPRGSELGFRPPGFEFRIMCLEGSVISFISEGSPSPV